MAFCLHRRVLRFAAGALALLLMVTAGCGRSPDTETNQAITGTTATAVGTREEAGTAGAEREAATSDPSAGQEGEEAEAEVEEASAVAPPPPPPPPKREYSPRVRIDLTAQQDGTVAVIEGETNLPRNSRLSVRTKVDGYYGGPGAVSVRVDQEGRFVARIPRVGELDRTRAWFFVTLDPTDEQPATLVDLIGSKGEHLTGPLVRRDGEKRVAWQHIHLDLHSWTDTQVVTTERDPAWQPDPAVQFAELKIDQDGRNLYVSGWTNLPIGTQLNVDFRAEGWVLTGYDSRAWVNADGSFSGRIRVPGKIKQADVRVLVRFDPTDFDDDLEVVDLYGANGEELTGDWVVVEDDHREVVAEVTHQYRAP